MEGMRKLTKGERMDLRRRASARNVRADAARPARPVLLLADGYAWAGIREKLGRGDSYINRWIKRFEAERLAGLSARHKVTEPVEARVPA